MAADKMNQAEVLVKALPYIKKYNGKTVVVKYGGNAMVNEDLKNAVMKDIVLLSFVGINIVLVHGGGPEINEMLDRLGLESAFVGGLRRTDAKIMEIVQMVLCGKTNKNLVNLLNLAGGRAVGLCGIDGQLIKAKKVRGQTEDMGFAGTVDTVNRQVLEDVMAAGYIPVISTVGCDDKGNSYNVNADLAAARIASEMGAVRLILMTDIRGLLRDKEDESTLIPKVNVSEVPFLKKQGIISGGMIPKVDCCVESVRRGVESAVIIDGRQEHSILMEILSDSGSGTMFV